jgi:hypothetical protein
MNTNSGNMYPTDDWMSRRRFLRPFLTCDQGLIQDHIGLATAIAITLMIICKWHADSITNSHELERLERNYRFEERIHI